METIKKKILVITTKGCIGCEVAVNNTRDAIKQVHNRGHIIQENKDWKEVDRTLLKENKVKDYPTTIFFANHRPRFKYVGSYPIPVLVRWIDLYMK